MKKHLSILFVFLFPFSVFSQNIKQIDSVTIAMCESLEKSKIVDDTLNVKAMFFQHLPGVYEKFNVSSQNEADSLNDKIYYRLQRNCNLFREILRRLEPNKSDWKILNEKPLSKISENDFKKFIKHGKFTYKEYNGSIVSVTIEKNVWLEIFEDGTYSKLKFISKKDGEFDLEFIESNNEIRKNFSIKGDIYNYGLFLKDENCYHTWVKNKDNTMSSFKLYQMTNH